MSVPPEIRFNYLTDPYDMRMGLYGLNLVRELASSKALSEFIVREHAPGPTFDTEISLQRVLAYERWRGLPRRRHLRDGKWTQTR